MPSLLSPLLEFNASRIAQTAPYGPGWLPWGVLLLLVLGGAVSIFVHLCRLEREKCTAAAEAALHRDNLDRLVVLLNSLEWKDSIDKTTLNLLGVAKQITGAQRAYAASFDIQRKSLLLVAAREDFAYLSDYATMDLKVGRLPYIIETHQPVIHGDLRHPHPQDADLSELLAGGAVCGISLPLLAKGDEMLGTMSLFFEHYIDWTEQNIAFYTEIGGLIGRALKFKKMTDDYHELNILQERKRLSQELHDNFSQLVSALKMRAEAARLTCEEGDFAKIPGDLERIVATTQEVQNILRDEMIGLRNLVDERSDLMPLVRDSVERFRQFSSIQVILDEIEAPAPLFVPVQVGMQFIRILQEGLSNVRRHSLASRVIIRIGECGQCLCLTIEDNGRGFDAANVPPERLGLRILEERAQDVGGKVDICSSNEQGTRIEVEIPLYRGMEFERNDGNQENFTR